MPGHSIEAKCGCGFEKELLPGVGDAFVEYDMAYTGDDLDTFEHEEAERRKLRVLEDPFLEEENASNAELLAGFERKEKPQGAYDCPRCKNKSLFLRFSGYWD
jgi:hypothetical protein